MRARSPAASGRWTGQLTATVHADGDDLTAFSELLADLEQKAGRIVFNGFPTGVEVAPAMNHGGPYPATTDARFTSVGTAAMLRFARPVCYQNVPDDRLPPALQNRNPLGIRRMVNGAYTGESGIPVRVEPPRSAASRSPNRGDLPGA